MLGVVRSTSTARISTSSSNALNSLRRSTYSQTFFLPACSFSTPPTTPSVSKDASTPHSIPLTPVKPKVELRPGPIKPPIATSNSQNPRTKKHPTTKSSQPQSTSSTTKPSGTIAETLKEDLKQAYIHGILARPPPDAGKVATLWHQAKELFVRWLFELNSVSLLNSCLFQKFYFRGLKLVVTHRKQVKAIQARVKAGGEPLSRWESRFILTNQSDLTRYLTVPGVPGYGCYTSSHLS